MQTEYATIDRWSEMTGLGRTKTYYLLGEGKLRAIKAGRRTLIDVAAGMAWLRSQPAAEIRCSRARRAAA